MSDSNTPKTGDFAHWVEEKSEALKFELGNKFPVLPTALHSPSVHVDTSQQKLEEVLLEHEQPTQEFLEELAALEQAPALSDDELARQALEAGGADGESTTPE
jgi:peptidoglycan hydrolase CwlO-like protein